MRWLQTEYILKGVYLGLLVFVAMQEPEWQAVGLVALCTIAGLLLCLAVAAGLKLRQGYQVRGRYLAFTLFLLLESPTAVYAGTLLGMAVGTYLVRRPGADPNLLAQTLLGGVLLGVAFGLLHQVRDRRIRIGASLLLAAALVTAGLWWFGQLGEFSREGTPPRLDLFGLQLLLGMPMFYLLTFAGREEESEVEVGALFAALGLGVFLLADGYRNYQTLALAVAVLLYLFYATHILPGLRVFKHSLRGMSYTRVGRYRQALQSFRRALELDPNNALAREGMWGVHRAMDLTALVNDPKTLALIDLDMCLERVGSLLLSPTPGPEKLDEANRLLDLVLNQKPALRPAVHYWRAVARTHAHQLDEAVGELNHVLDPSGYARDDEARRGILLQAWQLGLLLHGELNRRCGTPQLAQPGRRMEAIAAVERRLSTTPDDADAWNLKRLLYSGLTEADYEAAARPDQAVGEFDYAYCQQLGLALINDRTQWQRGGEYLRLAAHGLPTMGPSLFTQIAQAHERAGNADGAQLNYELAKRAGLTLGAKNLADDERPIYFAAVKLLAEQAHARGDLKAAIENYHLYTEYERSGVETRRTLAELYEKRGDPLAALRATEQALLYNAKDKDLLARKDRYYYSVMPNDLCARLEAYRSAFDVQYCLRKARSLLDLRDTDLDLLDWAEHLLRLAEVIAPENRLAKVLLARARLRRGERNEAVALLEAARSPKPESFADSDDEEAWYMACRLLGELYLYDLGKPDLAVPCFQDFKNSAKSGADTMYRLGQAYEQLGDRKRAMKYYELVTAYEGHPLGPDAHDALYRLRAS
jgi:tetratricopeptide (TPR) repeat protein